MISSCSTATALSRTLPVWTYWTFLLFLGWEGRQKAVVNTSWLTKEKPCEDKTIFIFHKSWQAVMTRTLRFQEKNALDVTLTGKPSCVIGHVRLHYKKIKPTECRIIYYCKRGKIILWTNCLWKALQTEALIRHCWITIYRFFLLLHETPIVRSSSYIL